MPKALVLDFGGVVTRTMFETHRHSERALQLAPGTLRWLGPFDPEGDDLWRDMINGKISERTYWQTRTKEVGMLVGKDWTRMQDFVLAVRASAPMEIIRPEFLAALEKIKAEGIRLAILSNELDLFYGRDFRKKLPFMKDFTTIIDATYTKILKPDRRAYQAVVEALEVEPNDSVFVDDQLRNIVGAKTFGMEVIHFNVLDPQASYTKVLSKLGIPS